VCQGRDCFASLTAFALGVTRLLARLTLCINRTGILALNKNCDYATENAGSKQQLPIAGLSLCRMKSLLKIVN
jgi:hypothetical protein